MSYEPCMNCKYSDHHPAAPRWLDKLGTRLISENLCELLYVLWYWLFPSAYEK